MPRKPQLSEYEKLLGTLEGDAFEDEVCARLRGHFSDFQRIPDKPSGDGGLDGLSHGQERSYCCYGPEQDPVKLKRKDLKDDIVKKFNSDLRKLFELAIRNKRSLVHEPNAELSSIMGKGNKIKNLYLVVSWFETHRVLGPLNTAFNKYMKASELRYIDAGATLTIWGPKDLATLGEIDEHTLFRIQNRSLFDRVKNATATALSPASTEDFDAKFDDLKRRRRDLSAHIDALAADFRDAWAAAIAFDDELASTSVQLHESLETARSDAVRSARLRSMGSNQPHEIIEEMRRDVVDRLGSAFGERLGTLTSRIADGVVAGLIGECPLEWRDGRG